MSFCFDGDNLYALKKYAESSEEMIWFVTSEEFTVLEMNKRFKELTRTDGETPSTLYDLLTEQSTLSLEKTKAELKI